MLVELKLPSRVIWVADNITAPDLFGLASSLDGALDVLEPFAFEFHEHLTIGVTDATLQSTLITPAHGIVSHL